VNGGRLIAFEGLDGCGKSTQLERLAARLRALGCDVVTTREPSEFPSGQRIREMARSGVPLAAEQELRWFVEDRRVHVAEVIAPALRAGQIVLTDRYYLSTVAYQGARGLDADAILAESEARFPSPDLTLVFEIDPRRGLDRVHARGGVAEPVFEELGFLERVAAGFAALDRPHVVRLDADRTASEVATDVLAIVHERLGVELGG